MSVPVDMQQSTRAVTFAFLACGCRTVYDDHDPQPGQTVVCPNLLTCEGHHGGRTTVRQTLTGTLLPPALQVTA
jgi:predicted secreted protein